MSEQLSAAVTRVEVEGLGEAQELALAALRLGSTFRHAAEAAGVARPTIYRWMQTDPHFRAAYNAWKQEQGESARGRLLQLADEAVDVIANALRGNDRKAAVQVLKSAGALRPGRPQATDAKVVELQMDLRRFQEEYRAARAMVAHLLTRAGFSPAEQRRFIREHGVRTEADSDPRTAHRVAPAGEQPDEQMRAEFGQAVNGLGGETTAPPPTGLSRDGDDGSELQAAETQ